MPHSADTHTKKTSRQSYINRGGLGRYASGNFLRILKENWGRGKIKKKKNSLSHYKVSTTVRMINKFAVNSTGEAALNWLKPRRAGESGSEDSKGAWRITKRKPVIWTKKKRWNKQSRRLLRGMQRGMRKNQQKKNENKWNFVVIAKRKETSRHKKTKRK